MLHAHNLACDNGVLQAQYLWNMYSTDKKSRPAYSTLRYRVLADEIEAMIACGDYRTGERLPSVRMIHRQRGLAIGTICHALAELEARGLIEARPRAGYFVANRRQLALPVTKATKPRAQRVPLPHLTDDFVTSSADKTLAPFGGTVLSSLLIPIRHLSRIARDVTKSAEPFTTYGPPAGDLLLRREICKQLISIGVSATSKDVLITSGCMNAMRLAVGVAIKPGDTVVVESPTFFALLPMLRDAGLLVATDSVKGIDLDALEAVATSTSGKSKPGIAAVIVTPHFQNPTGACMSILNKHRLLALSRRFEFAIIEDDVYGDLYFGVNRPSPITALAQPEDRIFYCSSFSKTLAAGLRIGYVVNRSAMSDLARAKLANTIASPVLNQLIIAEFLRTGSYQRHLRKLRTALRGQVAATTAAIANYFPADTQVTAPSGGFFLWLQLSEKVDSRTVYDLALSDGISILPGDLCSIDQRYRQYIRLSCGTPWSPILDKAIRKLATIIR
jgi:DNA-binding transcriptional MocR family regulator